MTNMEQVKRGESALREPQGRRRGRMANNHTFMCPACGQPGQMLGSTIRYLLGKRRRVCRRCSMKRTLKSRGDKK